MTTFEEILAMAEGRPEDTVPLCLRASLVAEHTRLSAELQTAPHRALSLGEPAPAKAIAAQIVELEKRMQEASVPFKLRALAPLDWTRFLRGEPEKKDGESDDDWDERWLKFLCAMVSVVCYDPPMSPDQVEQLVPNLSSTQWANLANRAWTLNSQRESVPFSAAASVLTRTPSDE